MALNLRPIQLAQRKVPLEQIVSVKGQNPVASGIDQVSSIVGKALERKAELRRQGQVVSALASAAGEQNPNVEGMDPATFESLVKLKTDRAAKAEQAAKDAAELRLKLEHQRTGYSEYDPTTNTTRTYNGVKGLNLQSNDAGYPQIVEGPDYAPALKPIGGKSGAGGGGADQSNKDDNYYFKIMNGINSDTKARAAVGIVQQKLNNIGNAKALLDQIEAQPGGPDQRQMFETALSTARSLMGNGMLTEGEINQMIPSTYKGNFNKFIEKVTNEPRGLDAQQFVQRYKDTLRREAGVSQQQLEEARTRWMGAYDKWFEAHPQHARDAYKSLNLKHPRFNPDQGPVVNPFDLPAPGAAPAAAGAPQAATHRWNPATKKVEVIQ